MESFISPRSARPRLLFPVKPAPNETLLGFVVRTLSQNHLGTPVTFMRNLGLDMKIKGDFLSRLQARLPEIAEALSMPEEALQGLWGAEPLTPSDRRLLGGVFLRPALVEQNTLRVPPSIKDDTVHDPRWMIQPIEFCSKSWEVLVSRCPGPRCREALEWPRAESLHLCRRCGRSVRDAPRKRVPKEHRASLQWVMDFFDDSPVVRDIAFKQIPPFFRVNSETEAFEIILAMRNLSALACKLANVQTDNEPSIHWAWAGDFIRSYPRSAWDLIQGLKLDKLSNFPNLLRRIARDSNVAVVKTELNRISHEKHRILWDLPYQGDYIFLDEKESRKELSVNASQFKALRNNDFIVPYIFRGKNSKKNKYDCEDIFHLEEKLKSRYSYSKLISDAKIPIIAIEQLLALGYLELCTYPEVHRLFGSRQIKYQSAKNLIWALRRMPTGNNDQWVMPIEMAFLGVGAREKPWGPILGAAINKSLVGGLGNQSTWINRQYALNPIVAHTMVMGGPNERPWYNFEPEQYGQFWRDWLAAGETQSYLNCSAVEISFLRERDLLVPRNDEYKSRYSRTEVHEFALKWMHTREAAARCGVTPREIWKIIRQFQQSETLGRGFFLREEMEEIIQLEKPRP